MGLGFVVIFKWHPYLVTFNDNLDHRLFNKSHMGHIAHMKNNSYEYLSPFLIY